MQELKGDLDYQNQERKQDIQQQNMQSQKVMNLEEKVYEAQQRGLWKLAAPQEKETKVKTKKREDQLEARQKKWQALAKEEERQRYLRAEHDQQQRYKLAVEQGWEQKHLGEIVSGDTGYNSIMTHKQARIALKKKKEQRTKALEKLSRTEKTIEKARELNVTPQNVINYNHNNKHSSTTTASTRTYDG